MEISEDFQYLRVEAATSTFNEVLMMRVGFSSFFEVGLKVTRNI